MPAPASSAPNARSATPLFVAVVVSEPVTFVIVGALSSAMVNVAAYRRASLFVVPSAGQADPPTDAQPRRNSRRLPARDCAVRWFVSSFQRKGVPFVPPL